MSVLFPDEFGCLTAVASCLPLLTPDCEPTPVCPPGSSGFIWTAGDLLAAPDALENWFRGANWLGGTSPGLGGAGSTIETVTIALGASVIDNTAGLAGVPSTLALANLDIHLGAVSTIPITAANTIVSRLAITNGTLAASVTIDSTTANSINSNLVLRGTDQLGGQILAESNHGTFTIAEDSDRGSVAVTNTGTIEATNGDTLLFIDIPSSGGAGLANDGLVEANHGTVDINLPLSGNGTVLATNGGTVYADHGLPISSNETFEFGAGTGNVIVFSPNDTASAPSIGEVVGGFAPGDTLDLAGFTPGAALSSSYDPASGKLSVSDGTHSQTVTFKTNGGIGPVVPRTVPSSGTIPITAVALGSAAGVYVWANANTAAAPSSAQDWFTGANWQGGVSPALNGTGSNSETVVIAQGAPLLDNTAGFADTPVALTLSGMDIVLGASSVTPLSAANLGVSRLGLTNGTLAASTTIDSGTNAGVNSNLLLQDSDGLGGQIRAESASGTFVVGLDNANGSLSVINTGTITASHGDTLIFLDIPASGTGTLTNDGEIDANGGTVALQTPLAGTGTVGLSNAGTVYADYGLPIGSGETFAFGAGTGNLLVLSSNDVPSSPSVGEAIANFGTGDTLDLAGFTPGAAVTQSYNPATGKLTVSDGSHSETLTFSNVTGSPFVAPTVPGNGVIVVTDAPCYLRGTRIATKRGEIAVEALREGDEALLASGRTAPIVWIGRRRVNTVGHPNVEAVYPVRIKAGAFGVGLPKRDLLVSPDHALFLDGALVPAQYLVNGTAIVQEAQAIVEYFHVELPSHDILLAEGLPAESYLDTGNRRDFANGTVVALRPSFARVATPEACAPLVIGGERLAALRALAVGTTSSKRSRRAA